ncbi:hypothetical protein Airi01_026710 [Actinoallomurus iriomotensis]|uniref:Uncharacterized protein n=1 Tax=Actinoallomurus iriomotensis TaxID=478107 RepID=A0A9W6REK4_9ACTN|nr:hypothetical protein Airi01_026710 [Actinoallomurus iriomotensis]
MAVDLNGRPTGAEVSMKRTARRWTFVWLPTVADLGFWDVTAGLMLNGPTKVNGRGGKARRDTKRTNRTHGISGRSI